MANPIISGLVETVKNAFGNSSQAQTTQEAAAAVIQSQSNSKSASQNTRPTPGRGNYGATDERRKSEGAQALITEIETTQPKSTSGSGNILQDIAKENKPDRTVTEAMRDNSASGIENTIKETTAEINAAEKNTADISRNPADYSKWLNQNVDWETPKGNIIEKPQAATNDGGIFNDPVQLVGTVAGLGVAAKVAPAVISKLPAVGKEAAKAGAGFTIGGGLAGAGGETEVSKQTTEFSSELKELSSELNSKADTGLEKIGAFAAGVGLGAVGGLADTAGALTSAGKGAFEIGKDILSGDLAGGIKKFGAGIETAGKGILDWAENANQNPGYSIGEIVGFGGAAKGISAAGKLPDAIKTKTIEEAQADITGSFSNLAGFDRQATEKAFKAAGSTVRTAGKIDIPLVSKDSIPLKELTLFEDIDSSTLGKIERSLSDAEVVNYGTTANVLYGLEFRKTSDFDASVPGKNAEKLLDSILRDTEQYGTRPSKALDPLASSWQIERPSPQSGNYAHMFDLKRLEQQNDDSLVSTSTLQRTPTKAAEYTEIKIPGSSGSIKVEPLEFALSRKYAATYFPRTDQTANIKLTDWIAPRTINYDTKIDLESYKTGQIRNLPEAVTRSIPVSGFGFQVARGLGSLENIGAKARGRGIGNISKQINYPVELGDAHRMKDALDLIGISWEYKTSLIDKSVRNPITRSLYRQRIARNLDVMVKDDYLRAQIKTGASQKLSDLSVDFARFLHSQDLLTDTQLSKVMEGKQPKTSAAFRTGTPDLKRFEKLSPSPATTRSRQAPSPFSPTPSPLKGTTIPKGYTIGTPSPKPSPSPFSPTPSPYGGKSSTKPGRIGGFTGRNKSIVTTSDFPEFFTEPIKRSRKKDENRLEDDFGNFRKIKLQRIDHFGIYDPLEFVGAGSLTKRNRPELTTKKGTIYEVNGGYTSRKPKGKGRR